MASRWNENETHRIHTMSLRCRFAHLALFRRPQELEGDDDLQEKLRRRKQFDDNDEDMYGRIGLRVGVRAFPGRGRALRVERGLSSASCLSARVSGGWLSALQLSTGATALFWLPDCLIRQSSSVRPSGARRMSAY